MEYAIVKINNLLELALVSQYLYNKDFKILNNYIKDKNVRNIEVFPDEPREAFLCSWDCTDTISCTQFLNDNKN
jgi:hypothetical protein